MPASRTASTICRQLDELTPPGQDAKYTELVRIAKVSEEAGEAMEALFNYHQSNPRKPQGTLEDLVKELADVAISAQVALEHLGMDSDQVIHSRSEYLVDRLNQINTTIAK